MPVDPDLPTKGLLETGDQTQQAALASPVVTDDANAWLDQVQCEAIEYSLITPIQHHRFEKDTFP